MTALQLIRAAMRVAQVIEKGEDPPADEVQDALETMDTMLKSWGARRLMVRATVPENFPLVSGQNSYTIGVGMDFNTVKPFDVKSAFVRDGNTFDSPVSVVPRDLYDSMQDKDVSLGRPKMLAYDPGQAQQTTQAGTILLYPIPDSSSPYTLYMDTHKPFSSVSTLTEAITFESPYEELIKYELAKRLWREYHKASVPVPMDILGLAGDAMRVVETMNQVKLAMSTDLPSVRGGSYNVYTGGYNG